MIPGIDDHRHIDIEVFGRQSPSGKDEQAGEEYCYIK